MQTCMPEARLNVRLYRYIVVNYSNLIVKLTSHSCACLPKLIGIQIPTLFSLLSIPLLFENLRSSHLVSSRMGKISGWTGAPTESI